MKESTDPTSWLLARVHAMRRASLRTGLAAPLLIALGSVYEHSIVLASGAACACLSLVYYLLARRQAALLERVAHSQEAARDELARSRRRGLEYPRPMLRSPCKLLPAFALAAAAAGLTPPAPLSPSPSPGAVPARRLPNPPPFSAPDPAPAAAIAPQGADAGLPLLRLTRDDTEVSHSCRVSIPPGLIIADQSGDGVLRVTADGVRLLFEPGSVLRGAPDHTPGDQFDGIGIRVEGRRDVTIEGAVLSGFRVGLLARAAPGLSLREIEVRSGRRQRLFSTAEAADDTTDWLDPHHNDRRQWVTHYGAGLCVERSDFVSVRGCRVRRTQNGLILDRVHDSQVLDNDFSYLSGWGVAMWRCDRDTLRGNSLDVCVRGTSNGVYNRGQDSAGLLMFEQCHDNLIEANSITHGGDGVFAFSGREALGEDGALPGGHKGLGHRGNVFRHNDMSYATAHGLELTFAFDCQVIGNRLADNAICGLWGGYSRGLVVRNNLFEHNGEAGYGAERGGINIEHGAHNLIASNSFLADRCGVRLWWDEDAGLAELPWSIANGVGCGDNLLQDNRFSGTPVAVELADCPGTRLIGNRFDDVQQPLRVASGPEPSRGDPDPERTTHRESGSDPAAPHPQRTPPGSEPPATSAPPAAPPAPPARAPSPPPRSAVPAERRGREHVLMAEWGPWDGEEATWRVVSRGPSRHVFELLGVPADTPLRLLGDATAPSGSLPIVLQRNGRRVTLTPADGARGYLPYRLGAAGLPTRSGLLSAVRWRVTCFATPFDPRQDEAAFSAAAENAQAGTVELDGLHLDFGNGGPSDLGLSPELDRAGLPRDHFGTLALASFPLPAGRWRLITTSDDGVRVSVDDTLLIDDWTWHAPTEQSVEFKQDRTREVHLRVEHFELDGWATLELHLQPVR